MINGRTWPLLNHLLFFVRSWVPISGQVKHITNISHRHGDKMMEVPRWPPLILTGPIWNYSSAAWGLWGPCPPSPPSKFLRLRFCQLDQKSLGRAENLSYNIDLKFDNNRGSCWDCPFNEWYFSTKIYNGTVKVTFVMAGPRFHNPISSRFIHSSTRFPSVYGRTANKMFLRRATQRYPRCRYDTPVNLRRDLSFHYCLSNN